MGSGSGVAWLGVVGLPRWDLWDGHRLWWWWVGGGWTTAVVVEPGARDCCVFVNVVPGAGQGVGRGDGRGPGWVAFGVWVWYLGMASWVGPMPGVWCGCPCPVVGYSCGGCVHLVGAVVGVWSWRLAVLVVGAGRHLRFAWCRRWQGLSLRGQVGHDLWRTGRLGCCGLEGCRCCLCPSVDACGVVRVYLCVEEGWG